MNDLTMQEYLETYFERIEEIFHEYGKEAMLKTINDEKVKDMTMDLFYTYCLDDMTFNQERAENLSIAINNGFQSMFHEEVPNIYNTYEVEIDDEIRNMTNEISEMIKEAIKERDEGVGL